ncbi:MAG: flagellar hook-associated protein FlgL [Planctomycetes bacterium]|jgi:flagellar hook-associated protein 3 FlgL|nr:flagellar hook-associated protein FlgL [Planctomycetota bacterium]
MSGSLTSIYEGISYALQLHGKAIMQLQEQASTGSRVNRGSDSPSEAYRILGLDSYVRSLDTFQENMTGLIGALEMSSTIITDMAAGLADARTVLTQIVGGIHDADGRQRIADKLDSTLEQLVSLANTAPAGQYLFGGNSTGAAPYTVQRQEGRITRVVYQGSDEGRRVDVAPGLDVEGCLVGDEIFRTDERGAPVFLGATGAAAGTGTSNARGDVWLTVDHDGAQYRLSLDDGVTFTTVPAGGAPNQAVTDSRTGRVLYVDTTGLQATGVELIRLPGTYDVFSTLISLRDMLINDRGLAPEALLENVNACVAGLEEVRNRLVQANVSTGSQVGFLDTLQDNLDNMKFDAQQQMTSLQEADVAQLAIDLSRREILYQMSLAVAGKLMTTSLLNFIE